MKNESRDRMIAYWLAFSKIKQNQSAWKKFCLSERQYERGIYQKLKQWEANHPILAFLIAAVLGSILFEIIGNIIVQGILMNW